MIGTSEDGVFGGGTTVPKRAQHRGHKHLVRTLQADEGLGVIVSGSVSAGN
jgi:hypothetical protein